MMLRWSRDAFEDLDSIWLYIAQADTEAADRVVERVFQAVRQLEKHSFIGRRGRAARTRELIVGRTSLIVVYRVHRAGIDILRIWHGARRWPNRF